MRLGLLAVLLSLLPGASPAFTALSDLNGEPVWTTKSDKFGEIRVRTVYLEAPDHLLALIQKPTSRPRWAFEGGTEASVRELLVRAGLPADMLARMMDPARRVMQDGALVIFPEIDDLLALAPAMRAALYPELAKSLLNEFHRDPVFIVGETLDDWLRQSRLGERQKAAFRRMVWKRGDTLVFSDLRTLLALADGPEETQEVFRTMSRTRALIADLSLPGKADTAALLGYWSAGFPDADTLPFLKGALRRASVTSVDVSRLLPPMARRRLYTYPTLDQAIGGRFPDCHWTSLNFFNNTPAGYYLDTRLASAALLSNYDPVEGPRRFGDVLVYVTGDSVIHSCVFVADDIVYTKNGENILAPWVLQRLSDVSAIYRATPDVQVRAFRLKSSERLRQR
jgi:hypothetical protein